MKRMIVLAVSALTAGFALSSAPASAAPAYPWCTRVSTSGGECAFNTFEQCMATLSGIGGACVENPGYSGPAPGGPYNAVPRRHRTTH